MPEKHVPAGLRREVAARAKGVCEYCRSQERLSPQSFSVEHIEPQVAGGQTSLNNLALSCQGCNGHKYTKQQATDPITGEMVGAFSSTAATLERTFCVERRRNPDSGLDANRPGNG